MYIENKGPIISSRHHGVQPPKKKGVLVAVIAALIMLFGVVMAFLTYSESQPMEDDYYELEEFAKDIEVEKTSEELAIEKMNALKEKLENEMAERVEEEATPNFLYKRALKKETEKDYTGAVEDYTATIEKATKHSTEMFNALNNRGIIKAQQLKDYKGAKADFNKIVTLYINPINGKINAIRLEAGYTNRAYAKKMLGDKEGACDDLYEALSLGVESSVDFIEQQINKNCY